ncbi:ABC transporter substrate-binding protein [Aggregicoccus sp. 17bor-14]|uniref:ABC transporter substrate-binding protein n=1 Tax=Myxococcaceae TaxID=31 RepID=UPI00129C49DC|nr:MULTISPECIES: helical backbone metal receptor [Myxococcaceae]MBF5041933.1 ABC transporter substrate-binding protein [Simulacricoccus sp. 17bor-14]MRI87714.1 ABC transporter substrate-binding protein [Aggregicoccus sp. 17bor-14]
MRAALALLLLVASTPALAARPAGPYSLGPQRAAPVRRVVTLAPSLTEMVVALGAGERLVGVSRFDQQPEVAKLPRVGGFTDPSVEAVLALKPDLVLVFPGPGNQRPVEKMAQLGLRVLVLPLQTVQDTLAAMRAVGDALGRGAEAQALVSRIEATRARVRAAAAKSKRPPRVLFVYGFEPLVVAGPGSFADELLHDAGGVNIAADAGTPYPVYSPERAVVAKPDVVIDAADVDVGKDKLRNLPGLREARWAQVPTRALLQPGPSLGRGLEELYALLHPEN